MTASLNGCCSVSTAACMSSFFSQPTSEPSRTCQSPLFTAQCLLSLGPSNASCTTFLPDLAHVGRKSAPFSAKAIVESRKTSEKAIRHFVRIAKPLCRGLFSREQSGRDAATPAWHFRCVERENY